MNKISKFRVVSFTIDQVDEFIDALHFKLKQLSPDLDFNVNHGNVLTSVIFSGSHLHDYYFHQVSEASKESGLSAHNFNVSRRGKNYVIKIKH